MSLLYNEKSEIPREMLSYSKIEITAEIFGDIQFFRKMQFYLLLKTIENVVLE